MNEKIKCHVCGGNMDKVEEDVLTGWGDYEVTVRGIKGYACALCGERLYSAKDVRVMQELSKSFSDFKERPEYLNVTEVADLLRVSNQTVYNMIRDKRISAYKIGREWRFNRRDIEDSLRNQKQFRR